MGKNKGTQKREDVWHPLSPGRPPFPAGDCFLLEIGSNLPILLEASWLILDDPDLLDLMLHWHQKSTSWTRLWVATFVKECRLWEIKWDMQLNAHGSIAISMRGKNHGILVQTLVIGLSKLQNWGHGTKLCILNGTKHRLPWLVTISALVLGEFPVLLSGWCST
jgi:hypothetical protein